MPLKNKVLPPDTVGFDGSSRDNWCYAWGSWDFLGTSGYETWTGFELVFDSLEAQACRPYNLGYFGEGATKRIRSCLPTQGRVSLKNQVLPKHCFFLSWCFDSLEAQGVSTLQNLAVFHSLGYFLGGCH